MNLLEQYEQQYAVLIAEITIEIGQLNVNGTDKELSAKIDYSLGEAKELLEQMNLEIPELSGNQRITANNKLNCAQAELKRLQNEYQTAKENARKSHKYNTNQLDTGSGCEDYFEDVSISNDQRQRLLENSEYIERTGNKLHDGYRVVLETETLGAQVLTDLSRQRDTIQTARSRLRDTNADLGRTTRTLNAMLLRLYRQKAILYIIGACFVVAVIISLYLTLTSNSRHS